MVIPLADFTPLKNYGSLVDVGKNKEWTALIGRNGHLCIFPYIEPRILRCMKSALFFLEPREPVGARADLISTGFDRYPRQWTVQVRGVFYEWPLIISTDMYSANISLRRRFNHLLFIFTLFVTINVCMHIYYLLYIIYNLFITHLVGC